MGNILCIETSTKVCSVALGSKGILVANQDIDTGEFSHAENINQFIESCLKDAALSFDDLDAVAISEGPGSYTGLRIGTSTAKGICYAKDLPLIALSTLKCMAKGAQQTCQSGLLAPMIDARRMEVFNAIYDQELNELKAVSADVLDHDSYSEFMRQEITFFGDGSAKWSALIPETPNVQFIDLLPSAKFMCELAQEKYKTKDFVDLAYFEPFYLKDFIAGKPKQS